MNIYRPRQDAAIGNLSLSMATHVVGCIANNKEPLFHKDIYNYNRNSFFEIPNVVDVDVPVQSGYGQLNSFIHLKWPHVMKILPEILKPTKLVNEYVQELSDKIKIKDCVAGFHIRRGTLCEDSKKFAFFPSGSQDAVESMIQKAIKIDKPVFVLSDSPSTKEYFLQKVPKAIALDLEIGFTADEHSQHSIVDDESFSVKLNSICEWLILSKLPSIYITAGGINGRNVDRHVEEGITSTFGYSAALYGGKIPYYVFNDGHIEYPDGSNPNKRYSWSDFCDK